MIATRGRTSPSCISYTVPATTQGSWIEVGRANFIVDNLLAGGKAAPMIIVMPFGHAVSIGDRSRNTELFQDDLLGAIIPDVEKRYRVQANAAASGHCGFIDGRGAIPERGLTHLDRFAWVGAFSPGGGYAGIYLTAEDGQRKLKLLWIGCGKEDRLMEGARKFSASLNDKGIRHQFIASDGAHNWRVWRRYLHEFVPLLFR